MYRIKSVKGASEKMAQVAKQWLARQSEVFTIDPKSGGIVGSLIGEGYVEKEVYRSRLKDDTLLASGPLVWTGKYQITSKGKEWIKNQ